MKTNWQTRKLGEVCDIFNGNSINAKIKKEKYFGIESGYPFIATKDVGFTNKIDYENGVKIPKNDSKFKTSKINSVLICAEGGSAGRKIGFTEKEVCFGNKLFSIHSEKQDNKFIYYFCFTNYFQKEFKKSLTGIIGGVSLKKFKDIIIQLPPLPEQHRIVKILDEVFADMAKAKENAEKNLQNAKELFESYLQSVFANPGKDWEEKTLKEITSLLGDGLHGTPKYTVNGEYYFINGNNLNNGNIIFKENTKRVSVEEYYKYKKNLNDRTILVSINGTLCNVAFFNNEKIILGKSACYFNLLDGIDKNFIKYVILSPYFIKYAFKEATGATIKNVSLKTMREFKIYLPGLKEQKSIVAKLDALSAETKKLEAIYRQKLADLEELKKSVLKKAFGGEL